MATIRPNDNAPSGEVNYNLPTATFSLGEGGSYETEDRRVLSDAEVHPWLEVEYPEAVESAYTREPRSVPYEDDALSAPNSIAFDVDEIEKIESEKAEAVSAPTAIDAGLDQGESGTSGKVSTTLDSAEDATAEAEAAEPVLVPVADEPTPDPDTTPRWSADQED